MPKQTIIQALPRSGSTILLDCFNLSPYTHCRNEPHTFDNSLLNRKILCQDDQNLSATAQNWDEVSKDLRSKWGSGDLFNPKVSHKLYFKQSLWSLNIPQVVQNKASARSLLSILYPELRKQEYELPKWFYDSSVWQNKTNHIYKVGFSLQKCLGHILSSDPDARVIFLVRHPLGYAQSLYNRMFKQDMVYFTDKYLRTLKQRIAMLRDTGAHIPDLNLDSLEPFDIILLNWFVSNEFIYSMYGDRDQVMTVIYEELLANPEETVEEIFNHSDIPWNSDIKESVSYIFSGSAKLAQSFRKKCSSDQINSADNVLNYSSLSHYWDNSLWNRLAILEEAQSQKPVTYSPY
jgi:hypothetical protein